MSKIFDINIIMNVINQNSSEQLDEDNLMGKIDDESNIKEKQGFI